MNEVYLVRSSRSIEGTFGKLSCADPKFAFVTAELPWNGNKKNISCIPPGAYKCEVFQSAKFGKCFTVKNVPDRSGILLHHGNFAGDTAAGWASNSDGCILLGETLTKLWAGEKLQKAIGSSVAARKRFEAAMMWKPFWLTVIEVKMQTLKFKRY